MGPVLACRLVSELSTSFIFETQILCQILDLRERGSQTVSHSEGTGMAAFTTKSITQNTSSPFTPPHNKSGMGVGYCGGRHVRTVDSNIVLSTLGSIHHDLEMSVDQEDAEMDDIRLGMGMDMGSLSTAIGGDDGEPITDSSRRTSGDSSHEMTHTPRTPAPAYRALELGFRSVHRAPSLTGIRVDVEKQSATM